MAAESVLDPPRGGETSATAFDVDRPDATAYIALAAELRNRVSGDAKFDEYTQILYATDGSIHQARPAGVVLPRDVDDVRAVVETGVNHDIPVLPRETGSSLGGQTAGRNCIVIDFTRCMDDIAGIDPQARCATIQPRCAQDRLDATLADHGLKFAPDLASSNRSTVGGGIGSNSTGAHSIHHSITGTYTEELEVILTDGSLIRTHEVILDSDEYDSILAQNDLEANIYRTVRTLVENHESEVENKYSSLKCSVSGYNLQKVIHENDDGEAVINLSKLFVGAGGILGVIVEAAVSLVTKPDETALTLYCFDDLVDAMEAVPEAPEFPVSAVELMDDEVFRPTRESEGCAEYAESILKGVKTALMPEQDDGLVDDFEVAVADTNAHFVNSGAAFDVFEAYSEESQSRLWKLRKAAIPLLMNLEGDPKLYPLIEDTTVPSEKLAEYVQKFENVLENHGTSATYFTHAGSGTLHIRPILNLKENEGIEKMHSIIDNVTGLVVEHHGVFSGGHGDGMARTEFSPKIHEPEL